MYVIGEPLPATIDPLWPSVRYRLRRCIVVKSNLTWQPWKTYRPWVCSKAQQRNARTGMISSRPPCQIQIQTSGAFGKLKSSSARKSASHSIRRSVHRTSIIPSIRSSLTICGCRLQALDSVVAVIDVSRVICHCFCLMGVNRGGLLPTERTACCLRWQRCGAGTKNSRQCGPHIIMLLLSFTTTQAAARVYSTILKAWARGTFGQNTGDRRLFYSCAYACNRDNSRAAEVGCHVPPRGVSMPRSFS
jgi:hypothetical protein